MHKKWSEWFSGKDRNSICQQIYDLIWYTAVYRIVYKSGQIASKGEQCGMINDFIDKCFWEYQLISIRRLLDEDKTQRTISLYRLLDSMESNYQLLTRYNYFYGYDKEYDVDKIKGEYEEYAAKQKGPYQVPPRLVWEEIERRHSEFDKLSNKKNMPRKENNCVNISLFGDLKKVLKEKVELKNIETIAHKFIAHAESPEDRRKSNVDQIKLSLEDLYKAHEIVCKIATFLGKYFFDGCGGFLGVPQFDQFENIEKPMVKPEEVSQLRGIWNAYWKETESWSYFDINECDKLLKSENNNEFSTDEISAAENQ